MKRLVVLGIALASSIVLGGAILWFCVFPVVSMVFVHQSMMQAGHEYQPYSISSYDGKYILTTNKIEDSTGVYATFSIMQENTQDVIFECDDQYRTWDLKTISWIENTHDVEVRSSDVGNIVFLCKNKLWVEDDS